VYPPASLPGALPPIALGGGALPVLWSRQCHAPVGGHLNSSFGRGVGSDAGEYDRDAGGNAEAVCCLPPRHRHDSSSSRFVGDSQASLVILEQLCPSSITAGPPAREDPRTTLAPSMLASFAASTIGHVPSPKKLPLSIQRDITPP
jgi:hypothetical protein